MNVVYSIRDCCGEEFERVEITLPAGCTDPSDCAAKAEALKITGYDGHGRCRSCSDQRYRAYYVGYPIPAPGDATVVIEGDDRNHLIATLEMLLARLRIAPKHVSRITCSGGTGCIE